MLTAPSAWETWSFQYNVRGQMTREKAVSQTLNGTALDMEYRYSATANDGRIVQMKDWVSGEEVNYQYDELGRLIAAATTGPQWGLSWTYDGFGNRLAQNVTKGTAPVVSLSINAATNRITTSGFAYDAAGNLVQWPGGTVTMGAEYDVDGRLTRVTHDGWVAMRYYYDARNRRVKRGGEGWAAGLELNGLGGELLGVYGPSTSWPVLLEERVYFAGRLVEHYNRDSYSWQSPTRDRLGSRPVARRYPFGEGNNADNDEFATYRRDATAQHYYAWHRFYSATWGRFSSPDPYVMSGGLTNPQGWNRYSYVANDPVNYFDPEGLFALRPGFGGGPTLGGPALGPPPPIPEIWSVLPGIADLMSTVARFYADSDLLPEPAVPEWAKPGPAQLCGVNPVTGQPGIANRETGTAGELRPGVGGRGTFEARRETVRNGVKVVYPHSGIDIAGISGKSSVYASLGGQVTFAGETTNGGNTVIVDIGGGYRMIYMHLASLSVAAGDWVAMGQVLGVLGQTGNAEGQPLTEAHVHFEIRDGRRLVNPITFLNSPCPPGVRTP